MAKGKISEAERLRRKREYEKNRRLALNSDVEGKKKLQEKERLKYLAKKEKGRYKPIAKLSARDSRLKRKHWRINSQHYREKNKKDIDVLQSDLQVIQVTPGAACSSAQHKTGRKIVRRDRSKLFRANQNLEKKLREANRKIEMLRKRQWRLKRSRVVPQGKDLSTPRSKVKTFLNGENVSQNVRRKLLFGEVLAAELEDSFKKRKGMKQKQMFIKAISGKVLKKYRLLHACKTFLKYRMFRANENRRFLSVYERKKRSGHVTEQMQKDIVTFLEKDENSRMCPGKKDCITKNGVKMQKRLLNDSVARLHQKFLEEVGLQYKISYSTFCRLRPFYIVQPRIQDRDTCKCTKHANMELLVERLHSLQVISHRKLSSVLDEICCKANNVTCLLRLCDECKNRLTSFNLFDESEESSYTKWVTSKFSYVDKGVQKVSQRPCKQDIPVDIGTMVSLLKSELPLFMQHEASHFHHHQTINSLKERLGPNEVVIHIDFSENYACKYNEEIQAVHFGGGRQQISIHTVVVYHKERELETKAYSFASLSTNLRHDPAAIWAHLSPIFEWINNTFIGIDTVHFVSDSPATQYRNKKMFYLLSHCLQDIIPVKTCTWNFSESGHGKGAPDGIGGVLKRTADRIVAYGKDLSDFGSLISALQTNVSGVKLFIVLAETIEKMDSLFEGKQIETFVGTMKVHQVAFSAEKQSSSFRTFSCFDCLPGDKCVHYNIGVQQHLILDKTQDGDAILLEAPVENSDGEADIPLREGDWVVVTYEGVTYPGEVRNVSADSVTVSAMEETSTGHGNYRWPRPLDIHDYNRCDVQRKITAPVPFGSRANQFYFQNYP